MKNRHPDLTGVQFRLNLNTLDTIEKKYRGKLDSKGMDLLDKFLKMDPNERIKAEDALEHPFFDCLRPRRKDDRITSAIIEKHRAMSSTNKRQTSKHSAKENVNSNTGYGKFRGNNYMNTAGGTEYGSFGNRSTSKGKIIRSLSKGKHKYDENPKSVKNSILNNSSNKVAFYQSNGNPYVEKRTVTSSSGQRKIVNKTFKENKNFAINRSNNNYLRVSKRAGEDFEDSEIRNSSLKREGSKNRNNNQSIKMFQINEESEYKPSPVTGNKTTMNNPTYNGTSNVTNQNLIPNNFVINKQGHNYNISKTSKKSMKLGFINEELDNRMNADIDLEGSVTNINSSAQQFQ